MIQYHIMQKLQAALPSLEWTTDYRTADDNTGTVYFEGGSAPGLYDVPKRQPRYMVYIASSDWGFAEFAAMKVVELLHKWSDELITVEYLHDGQVVDTKHFQLQQLTAAGDVNPIGVENGVMDYSINFDAQLIELKEEA